MPEIERLGSALYNPATNNSENQRTPTTWKISGGLASGTVVIWTPAANKRYRVMGVSVAIGSGATLAAAGDLVLTWDDQGAPLFRMRASLPVTGSVPSIAGGLLLTWNLPGNGYLAPSTANSLRLGIATALTGSSQLDAMAWGTEE